MSVSTINKSGEDYNTLTLWEAAKQGVLAEIQEADCYNDDGVLTDSPTIDGSTTTSSYYMKITSPSGEHHTGVEATGFQLTGNITIADDYVVIEFLDIVGQIIGGVVADVTTIRKNIVRDASANLIRASTYGAWYIYRNIVYNGSGTYTCGISGEGSSVMYVYNNTIYNINFYAYLKDSGGTFEVKNCYGGSSGTGDFTSLTAGANNISSDATGDDVGTGCLINKAASAQFTSVAGGSENFHLKAGADCIDAGATLNSPYDVDIDDVTVSGTWDIGADEYVASGGTTGTGFMTLWGKYWG